jgi:hypothetical protein
MPSLALATDSFSFSHVQRLIAHFTGGSTNLKLIQFDFVSLFSACNGEL